ncbi:MAG: zinc ribbon domain-containing protein [Candidatus Kariarchaeaceae archaeon]|jgi:hypothetical protein
MVFCPGCGVQNDEGAKFCSNCGTTMDTVSQQSVNTVPVSYNQDSPQNPQYVNNTNYGNQSNLYQNNPPQHGQRTTYDRDQGMHQPTGYAQPRGYDQHSGMYPVEDKVNPFLYILALFFPIGIMLYFTNRREKPRSARNFLIAAFIGFFILL